MSQIWKTIPLFISSTFRDMHAERDQLDRVVFPAIAERLKPRRCRIAPIDLRVGVETDSTQTERERELQILKVCLAEIERSRPFLLVLLGDRYGWMPGEDRIQAAASEAGFTPEEYSGSVTALEIEFGLLKTDQAQRRRCLLCLREPLPYKQMAADKAAIYSDAHATDRGSADRVARLQKLKAKIEADPEVLPHRLPYTLDWDNDRQLPTTESVAKWGRKVEDRLWKLLDAETASFAIQAEPTWQEQERFAIEEQVERLNGSFVGRQAQVKGALVLAGSASSPGGTTGLVFTGGSGAGKSALFARLHHELSQHREYLLLTQAAGVSPRSGQTEWMLRRWNGELGAVLGERPDMPEGIKPEDLEELFAQLLHRVAAKRRVVMLVDALNQFLRTERARTVSWLPSVWPDNTRFIATTIPGEESTHLARRSGLTLMALPPLDGAEAEAIAAQVYGRYHRMPNADVLRELLAIRQSDGTPAAGNPLWLTLALDLLNQLDGDDFTAAEATAVGSPQEKLSRLVLERAHELPTDIEGLYGQLLAQVEKVASRGETRAFASLTALSRHGWREEDLQHLLPKAADLIDPSLVPHLWDPLRFAILRRCFRAHLVRRGALAQWDFAHLSLRREVLAWTEGERKVGQEQNLARALHAACVDYLEKLPSEDLMRTEEAMFHLVGLGDSNRAADYLSMVSRATYPRRSAPAITCAVSILVEAIQSAPDEFEHSSVTNWIGSFLETTNTTVILDVANLIIENLNDALAAAGSTLTESAREQLLFAARTALEKIAVTEDTSVDNQPLVTHIPKEQLPEGQQMFGIGHAIVDESIEIEYARSLLSSCCDLIAGISESGGDLTGAMHRYQESQALRKRTRMTKNPVPSDVVSQAHIADILFAEGHLQDALRAYQEIYDSIKVYAISLFADLKLFQLQIQLRLADVRYAQGDSAIALIGYRETLAELEDMAAIDRDKEESVTVGQTQETSVDLASLESPLVPLARMVEAGDLLNVRAASDPLPMHWDEEISRTHGSIGTVLFSLDDLPGALEAFRECRAGYEKLAAANPTTSVWQYCLAETQLRLGYVFYGQGNKEQAHKEFSAGLNILEPLESEGRPMDAQPLRAELSAACRQVGGLPKPKGGRGISYEGGVSARPAKRPGRLLPTPHPGAKGDRAGQLNLEYQQAKLEYQQALLKWNALPWWKRRRTKKPDPPSEIR